MADGYFVLSWVRISKAKEFEGPGGPEDKAKIAAEKRPGDQDTATEFIGKRV